jgi:hypothetical protein
VQPVKSQKDKSGIKKKIFPFRDKSQGCFNLDARHLLCSGKKKKQKHNGTLGQT